MPNCKAGDLAILVVSKTNNAGLIVKVIGPDQHPREAPAWVVESDKPLTPGKKYWWAFDFQLRPLRGTPGNESFVTESRKTLPPKKPVTGPVTTDNRGEVVR